MDGIRRSRHVMSTVDRFKEKLFFDAFHNSMHSCGITLQWGCLFFKATFFLKVGTIPSFLSHTLRSKFFLAMNQSFRAPLVTQPMMQP